jgi:hypothetical protein
VRAAKLDWVRNEITRVSRDICAQEREIQMLQRAGVSTTSAELLLSRIRAKLEDLCREHEVLRETGRSLSRAIRRHHAAFALTSDSAVSIARI